MTALHWAAYGDDAATVQFLLSQPNIKMLPNEERVTPVDVAGYCNNETIVYLIVKWLEKKLYREIARDRQGGDRCNTDENRLAPTIDVTSAADAKIQPSSVVQVTPEP